MSAYCGPDITLGAGKLTPGRRSPWVQHLGHVHKAHPYQAVKCASFSACKEPHLSESQMNRTVCWIDYSFYPFQLIYFIHKHVAPSFFFNFFLNFFKLSKYDNTFIGDLENTDHIVPLYITIIFLSRYIKIFSWSFNIKLWKINRMNI